MKKTKLSTSQKKIIGGYHDTIEFLQYLISQIDLSIEKNEDPAILEENSKSLTFLRKKLDYEFKCLLNFLIKNNIKLTKELKEVRKLIEEEVEERE